MPPFEKPAFPFAFDLQEESQALRAHKQTRQIPNKAPNKLLVATWNIANFGQQIRNNDHLALIAEILSWYDLIAVQETKDNFADMLDVVTRIGGGYRYVMSDVAGNNERLVFVYDSAKLTRLEMTGEIAIPPSQQRYIRLPFTEQKFRGFDRNPFIATFGVGQTSFAFVNVHLYWGSESTLDKNRRALETYAVGRWADLRGESEYAYTRDIVALGDFNMPQREPGDVIYDALTKRGLKLPAHSTTVGSSIASDARYDQIAFSPGATENRFTGKQGVFDFDQVIFADLWTRRAGEATYQPPQRTWRP